MLYGMTKPMSTRDVSKALRAQKCTSEEGGKHTKWTCSCTGKHMVAIPRHRQVSAGVVDDAIKRMKCLPEGWLQ